MEDLICNFIVECFTPQPFQNSGQLHLRHLALSAKIWLPSKREERRVVDSRTITTNARCFHPLESKKVTFPALSSHMGCISTN